MRDSLKFLCELPIYQEEQPYQLVGYPDQEATPQGENCVFEAKEIDVRNAREHPVTLQTHGFAFFQFKSGCELAARHFETVGGDNSILTKYLDETVEFVRNMFKPVDVICFDWRVSLAEHSFHQNPDPSPFYLGIQTNMFRAPSAGPYNWPWNTTS